MSLIGVTASGSSPEVIPLRPSQEAAGSVPSKIFTRRSAEAEPVDAWDLGRDRGRLGAGADDQDVADFAHCVISPQAAARVELRGRLTPRRSAITRALRSGLKEIALLRMPSARSSAGCRSTIASTVRSTRFISISA